MIQVRVRNGIRPDPTSGLGGVTEGDFRGAFSDIFEDGGGVPYLSAGHLEVHENSPVGMSVVVEPGVGYIPNANFDEFDSDTIKFWEAVNDADVTVAIAANSSGSTRIDLVCLYLDVSTPPNIYASNVASVVVVQGTPGAGVPSLPDDHLLLARVTVVNGAANISDSSILDQREQPALREDFLPADAGDGWTLSPFTLTYFSTGSVKVLGQDVTAYFPKGTKIKFTNNGTTRYFYVTDASFSTDTTITLTGGSDYAVHNSAITAAYYSYEETPQGFPDIFNWVPTWTGYSVSPTVSYAVFKISGKVCEFWVFCSANGTSGGGSSTRNELTLPVASLRNFGGTVLGYGVNSGAVGTTVLGAFFNAASQTLQLSRDASQLFTGWTGSGDKSANVHASYEI